MLPGTISNKIIFRNKNLKLDIYFSVEKSFQISVTSDQIGQMQRLDIYKEYYKDLEREQDRKTHTEMYKSLIEEDITGVFQVLCGVLLPWNSLSRRWHLCKASDRVIYGACLSSFEHVFKGKLVRRKVISLHNITQLERVSLMELVCTKNSNNLMI